MRTNLVSVEKQKLPVKYDHVQSKHFTASHVNSKLVVIVKQNALTIHRMLCSRGKFGMYNITTIPPPITYNISEYTSHPAV